MLGYRSARPRDPTTTRTRKMRARAAGGMYMYMYMYRCMYNLYQFVVGAVLGWLRPD